MYRNPRLFFRAAASLLRRPAATPQTPNPRPPLPPLMPHLAASGRRGFAGNGGGGGGWEDYGKEVDEINQKFAEAREEIEAAMEAKETVYFDEEAACARDAAGAALGAFDALLARLPEPDAAALRRSMGLKMEQLKAELRLLDE